MDHIKCFQRKNMVYMASTIFSLTFLLIFLVLIVFVVVSTVIRLILMSY